MVILVFLFVLFENSGLLGCYVVSLGKVPIVSKDHTGIISRIKQSKNHKIWLTIVGQGVVDLIPRIMACIFTKEETLTDIGRIKVKVKLKLSVYMP